MLAREKDSGSAAVEFALVLPFLLLLICGIVDFGRAYNAKITLAHAARESVRVWALGGRDLADLQDDVWDVAEATATGLTITDISPLDTACTFGETTEISVTASFSYITPMIGDAAPGLSELSTTGVMRCGG